MALGATERTGAQAVERAISVLNCFTGAAPRLGLAQLAELAHLPASTTYRIAQALVRGGLLERQGRDGYQMSAGMVALAHPALSRLRLEAAAPHLYRLAARIKLAVTLGLPGDSDLITVLCARPTAAVCEHQLPRPREPLHASAMGKATLAFGGQGPWAALGDLNDLERFTNRTLTSASALMADLALTRERGFAVSDEERAEGVRAVAVPVNSSDRDLPVGVIGVQACSPRLTDQMVRELVPALRHFAREVGRDLGAAPEETVITPTMRELACLPGRFC